MKRVLWILCAFGTGALLLYGAAVAGSKAAWQRAGRLEWPAGLGMLEDVPSRFPKHGTSAEALRLEELAKPLGIDFAQRKWEPNATEKAFKDFIEAERVRDVPAIGAPPAPVAELLTRHAGAIDAIAGHLRESRDIAWTHDLGQGWNAPLPNLAAHMKVMRVLVARALVRARSGDAGAWDDLRAASMLDRSLQRRPDFVSQVIALHVARTVNAAAWKLPAPAPAWLADDHAIDRRRLLLQGLQTDTWAMWRYAPNESRPFPPVYIRAAVANLVTHQRETAAEMSRMTSCTLDGTAYVEQRVQAIPRWNTIGRMAFVNTPWSQVLRYEAEREATANALRARSGQPVRESSRCSDGSWRSENGRIRFTREIASTEKDMPLSLHIR